MKNTTFESAMNSSSFASTESAAQKNEPLMCIKAIDKVKLYYDIWEWLEDHNYWDLSHKMYDVYYYYHVRIERNIKIYIEENDKERIITVDGEKLTCNLNVDYRFISKLLHDGINAYIKRLCKYRDESLDYLREFVENSYGKDLLDGKKPTVIVKIETVLKAEQENQ